MGSDPRTSAINRYLQSWEASNLLVMGGAAFSQNAGHNPTGTIGALTYWSAKAITSQYHRKFLVMIFLPPPPTNSRCGGEKSKKNDFIRI